MAFKFVLFLSVAFAAALAIEDGQYRPHEHGHQAYSGHSLGLLSHGGNNLHQQQQHHHHHEEQYNHAPAHYQFAYAVHDHKTGDIKEQEEKRDGHNVAGHYSLVEPDGHQRIVHYADNGHGFEAQVHREGHSHQVHHEYNAQHQGHHGAASGHLGGASSSGHGHHAESYSNVNVHQNNHNNNQHQYSAGHGQQAHHIVAAPVHHVAIQAAPVHYGQQESHGHGHHASSFQTSNLHQSAGLSHGNEYHQSAGHNAGAALIAVAPVQHVSHNAHSGAAHQLSHGYNNNNNNQYQIGSSLGHHSSGSSYQTQQLHNTHQQHNQQYVVSAPVQSLSHGSLLSHGVQQLAAPAYHHQGHQESHGHHASSFQNVNVHQNNQHQAGHQHQGY